MEKEIIKLCDHDDCTGCFACEAICKKNAISKDEDEEGFSYPVINHSICIRCHACQKVCPVLYPIVKNGKGEVYAAWINDLMIRKKSSSGGIFSAVALNILRQGGCVIGATMQSDNRVYHILISHEGELQKLRGSKYVQSNITRDLFTETKSHLSAGEKVLFCGTPCQVAGFKKYFNRNIEHLYTIDLVCHGVPSPKLFAKLLGDLKKDMPNLVEYNFRDTENWLVCTNVNVNVNVNGKIINKRLYGKYTFYQDAFLKGYLHRKNCFHCTYTSIERVGDITLADFWGIGKVKSFDGNIKHGCSLLSVNSDNGRRLFEEMKDYITYTQRDIQETIEGGNEQLIKPSACPTERADFYKNAYRLSYKELISKYDLTIMHPQKRIVGFLLNKIEGLKRRLNI